MKTVYDLIVIGAGASGYLAALEAKKWSSGLSVALIEKEEAPLRKVLASGNGRCNLVNTAPPQGHFFGEDPAFALDILDRFPASWILVRFRELGLLTLEDREGRFYPRSFQSLSVAMVLKEASDAVGIDLIQPATAKGVSHEGDRFKIHLAEGGLLESRALILATGSQAAPDLGGSSLGYELLASLGHEIRQPLPALVPLTLAPHPLLRHAQGVRFRGQASFLGWEGATCRSEGEFLITSYGLSGIAAMELGGTVARSQAALSDSKKIAGQVRLDFLPEYREDQLVSLLELSGGRDWRTALAGLLPDKIGRVILNKLEKEGRGDRAMPQALASLVKGLDLDVLGTRGFPFAYVASGGAKTRDFDPAKLMSRLRPGLFACGEVLDLDGETGGFNLYWAFASGCLAGRSAAAWLEADPS